MASADDNHLRRHDGGSMTGGYSIPPGRSHGRELYLRCRACAEEIGPVFRVPAKCPKCQAPKSELAKVERR